MALTLDQARARIDSILQRYRSTRSASNSILPVALTTGKVYEAWTLCTVLENLRLREGYRVLLRNGHKPTLKTAPGPINRKYPFFELTKKNGTKIEVWTDVEFLTLSHSAAGATGRVARGHYHELDIAVVPFGTNDRPHHDRILIGVECKNTGYTKDLLRGILGVRRELSLLSSPGATAFQTWPRRTVPADPPSCLLVYSTDPQVYSYSDPGHVFGIDFFHEAIQ